MAHCTHLFRLRAAFVALLLTASCAAGAQTVTGPAGDAPAATIARTESRGAPLPVIDDVFGADARGDIRPPDPLRLLGEEIEPGSYRQLSWSATELFQGLSVETPVLVVHGASRGPTLCLTAAVHGDELNGIEIVRRVLHGLQPSKLAGTVVGVPIVNIQGFRRGTRYLPDRRDLNRYFPGSRGGSAASRIASSFFSEIVLNCNALVDLHTGSFERTNLPQLRADLSDDMVRRIAEGFGSTVVLNSTPQAGTLRYAATLAGVPTVTLEAGGPARLEPAEVTHGVKGIETLLNTLGMVRKVSLWGKPEQTYYRSSWVRADRGGILLNNVDLGTHVRKGDVLGQITDPITNETTRVYSPFDGRVIGMARNQVVMPGFAAFHIGIDPGARVDDSSPPLEDLDAEDQSE